MSKERSNYTGWAKKVSRKFLSISLPNIDGFSEKNFHHHSLWEIWPTLNIRNSNQDSRTWLHNLKFLPEIAKNWSMSRIELRRLKWRQTLCEITEFSNFLSDSGCCWAINTALSGAANEFKHWKKKQSAGGQDKRRERKSCEWVAISPLAAAAVTAERGFQNLQRVARSHKPFHNIENHLKVSQGNRRKKTPVMSLNTMPELLNRLCPLFFAWARILHVVVHGQLLSPGWSRFVPSKSTTEFSTRQMFSCGATSCASTLPSVQNFYSFQFQNLVSIMPT